MEHMMIYNCAVFSTLFLVFLFGRTYRSNHTLLFDMGNTDYNFSLSKLLIAGFPMFILPACQYRVGTDYYDYIYMFKYGGFEKEYLYSFLNNILAFLDFNPQSIIMVTSFLIIYLALSQIIKESPMPILSILLYYCLGFYWSSFNTIRYCAAAAICFYSIRYIEKRELKKYLACMFAAVGFHYTALIFVPVYWLWGLKFNYMLNVGISFILFLFRDQIGMIFRELFSLTFYANYIGSQHDLFGRLDYRGISVSLVLLVIMGVIHYRENEKYDFYLNLMFLVLWESIFSGYIPLIARVKQFFGFSEIIFLPLMLNFIPKKNYRICVGVVIVACYVGRFLINTNFDVFFNRGWPLVTDYQTFFGMY